MRSSTIAFFFWFLFGVGPLLSHAATRLYGDVPLLEILLGVVTAILAVIWYKADAREEGIAPPAWLDLFIFALGAIAVPYYLLRYKGWRKGGTELAKIAGIGVLVLGIALAVDSLWIARIN